MAFDKKNGNEILLHIQTVWSLENFSSISVQDYADVSNHDSFCYLLEKGSSVLGEIGGITTSSKFGLWKYKEEKEFSEQFNRDNTYVWNTKYGLKRDEAFRKIRSILIDIIKLAQEENWDEIENVKFHQFVKWKVAFIYSNKRLVPIYERASLLKVASGLGKNFPENTPIVDLQKFIVDKKPFEEDMISFGGRMCEHFVEGKPFRNYYIIGTKYKDEQGEDTKDMYPIMLQNSIVGIGFLYNTDLSKYYGATDEIIDEVVQQNANNEDAGIPKVQGYFRRLLHLKPGDIIALKSKGSHGMLEIIAYAVVVERNGKVYEYNPELLGHQINVEFIETDIKRSTGLNYAASIHKVDSTKKDHLKKIFGNFMLVDNVASNDMEEEVNVKSEESFERGPIASKIIKQFHNIVQNSFVAELNKKFPKDEIKVEYHNRIDIMRRNEKKIWYYEVKPYENILKCMREATGQLLEYVLTFGDEGKELHLVVVGRGEKNELLESFFIDNISLPISYEQHIPERLKNLTE
ncbi:MAG TPA: hypothetical protein PLU10_02365 [Chitinophagaceae bacterium]|nr:hypothetical protein [Chitinophagaceae bacterium]